MSQDAESARLQEAGTAETIRSKPTEVGTGKKPWRKWGPYLSERQWDTVREDYSQDGNAWDYFTHDQARSLSRWTQFPESRFFVFNSFPGFECMVVALKPRNFALKPRTK
jgi:hypothetical protein